mgnify:FL=1
MRVVVQRCENASVTVENKMVGHIEKGLCLLVGFTDTDNEQILEKMVKKILNLRIFPDEKGIMNKNVLDCNGEILSVSQFTLYADTRKGNRPSYIKALNGTEAHKLYDLFNEKLKKEIKVETGIFGADMQVSLTNMGPTTILLEM